MMLWLLLMVAVCDATAVVNKNMNNDGDDEKDIEATTVFDINSKDAMDDVKLVGDNVCTEKFAVVKPVKVSYLVAVKEREYEWCLKITLRCPVWKTKMKSRERMENVTKIVNVDRCCAGYKEKEGFCLAVCSKGCVNGRCVEPERCECKAGYSGERCEEAGCPRGKWGVGCGQECNCKNGGFCDAQDGKCECTRGFKGEACEEKCGEGSFGEDCSGKCDCWKGEMCHFITGGCSPCLEGRFGEGCEDVCNCNSNNTAHCDSVDGHCVCLSNYFGDRCDLHCPFGLINKTCHIRPIVSIIHDIVEKSCECSNDLFICDASLGCVCPAGTDCGLEQLNQVNIGFLTKDPSRIGAIVAVIAVLIIGIIVIIVIIIYYRRRLKGIKKDLSERSDSSAYHENIVNNMPIRSIAELNMDELGAPLPPVQLSVQDLADSVHNPLYQHTHNFPNNAQQQQHHHQQQQQQHLSSFPNNMRPVKTTNISSAKRNVPSLSPQRTISSMSSTSSGYSSVSDLYKDPLDLKNNIDVQKVTGKNDDDGDDFWNGYENLEEAEYDQPKEPCGIAKQICNEGKDEDDDYDEVEDEESYDHLNHQRSNNDLSAHYHSTKSNIQQQPLRKDFPPGVPPRK